MTVNEPARVIRPDELYARSRRGGHREARYKVQAMHAHRRLAYDAGNGRRHPCVN